MLPYIIIVNSVIAHVQERVCFNRQMGTVRRLYGFCVMCEYFLTAYYTKEKLYVIINA